MQGLNAAPRDGLSVAQVTALLTGPTLTVSAGLELLNSDLTFSADISDDLVGGSVDRVMDATVHGTCKLGLSRALSWGTALVRPYVTLTDQVTARFNLGVFSLATPERQIGVTPETYDVTGYDRLYLLDRGVGDTYSVASGTNYLTAVTAAITAAGLSGVDLDTTASAKVLPADRVWPLFNTGTDGRTDQGATTWLRIVNDLLGAIGYRGLYADENGRFRSEPYTNPRDRPVEYAFDADSALTIVGEDRVYTDDLWAAPNKWVFLQNNPAAAPVEGTGIYTVTNAADGVTSVASRGLTWVKTVQLDAADQPSLVAQGDIVVAADKRIRSSLKVVSGPFPVAGHADVFSYTDAAIGLPRKVQAARWSQPLDGGDVSWDFEVVA